MFLSRLVVHNYKSLRNVSFAPAHFAAVIGPNASGKTNLADAFHFLSEAYTHGLELAVARKGGFENIAFRKQRRTKAAIKFRIEMIAKGNELRRFPNRRPNYPAEAFFRLVHEFEIDTPDTGISAEFSVRNESFGFWQLPDGEGPEIHLVKISLGPNKHLHIERIFETPTTAEIARSFEVFGTGLFDQTFDDQSFFLTSLPVRGVVRPFTNAAGQFAVFRLSPLSSRLSGVPTPNPVLTPAGENLPALVDWLQRKHPDAWKSVMADMKNVLPTLQDINVQYLHTKAIGLFFNEDGIGRPWSSDDVSDGTIQTLAMLTAAADPRTSLFLFEEPENSVHPWIIRTLVEQFRLLSRKKTVIVTTHSPVLIDLLNPEEAWILSRVGGETTMQRLVDLDTGLENQWKEGKIRLSEFLDAGFVPQAVPGGAV